MDKKINTGKNKKKNNKHCHMRRALSLLIALCILLNIGPIVSAATFTDVPWGYWAYDAIEYVNTNGYMNGVGNNQFNPSGVLSRAHIITVLHRVSQNTETFNYQPYSDVPSGTYYYTPVCWANSYSLSSVIQTSSTLFSPGSAVTRVKIAELIWKFAQTCGWATSAVPSITLPYTDIGNLTTTQKNALKWCKANAIMIGVTSTTFSPNTTITRAQFAQIVYNFDRYVATDRAFCVGTKYNDSSGLDTTSDAITAKYFYEDLGYTVSCVTVPTANIMQNTHNIKSNYLFFSGAANSSCIYFNYMQYGGNYKTGVYYGNDYNSRTGYKYVGINGNMDFVELAVFAGDNTAIGDVNIAKRACEYGADWSIGWGGSVNPSHLSEWLARFNSNLACGYTPSQAAYYSTTQTPTAHIDVTHYNIFTESNLRSNSTLLEDERFFEEQGINNILEHYDGDVTMNGENDAEEVAMIIQKLDKSFQIEDYDIDIYNHCKELTTIVYTKMIGGFKTDVGYMATLSSGKLISLIDKTKNISEEEKSRVFELSNLLGITRQTDSERTVMVEKDNIKGLSNEPKELTEALQLALEKTQASPEKEAAKQRYCYYYDVEKKTPSIVVYTDYYFDGTDATSVDAYSYSLDH